MSKTNSRGARRAPLSLRAGAPAPALVLALALVLATEETRADDISYTYFEGTVNYVDPDGLDSTDGYRFEGSLGLLFNLYGFARWKSADLDEVAGDFEGADFGVGWHLGLGDTLHGLVEAAWVDREAGLLDDDGSALSVGLRFAPGDRWEVGAKAGYRDLERNLDGAYGEAYALWKFWGVFGLLARAERAAEGNRAGLGHRGSF